MEKFNMNWTVDFLKSLPNAEELKNKIDQQKIEMQEFDFILKEATLEAQSGNTNYIHTAPISAININRLNDLGFICNKASFSWKQPTKEIKVSNFITASMLQSFSLKAQSLTSELKNIVSQFSSEIENNNSTSIEVANISDEVIDGLKMLGYTVSVTDDSEDQRYIVSI